MQDVVIVAATRTAIGSFQGSLSSVAASELGAIVIRALLKSTNLDPAQVDNVIKHTSDDAEQTLWIRP